MSTRYAIATLEQTIMPMSGLHPLACRGPVQRISLATAEEYEAAVIDSSRTIEHNDGSVVRVIVTGKWEQEL